MTSQSPNDCYLRTAACHSLAFARLTFHSSCQLAEKSTRRHPAQRGQNHPIARRLAEIHGVGPQTAGIFATEVFYRGFKNRRDVASYVGLTPTPYNSGTMVRDQGISKANNRRARAVAVELAWIWLRNQPESKLSRWFRTRVGDSAGRVRRIAIVALARKLIVALWHFLEAGVIPEGAKQTRETVRNSETDVLEKGSSTLA